MYKSWYVSVMALCLILVACAGESIAQVGWLNPEGKPGVQIEGSAGSFRDNGYDFPSGTFFLTARVNLGYHTHLITELPLFTTQYTATVNRSAVPTGSGIANPYFGIEMDAGRPTSALLAVGLRLPVISEANGHGAMPVGSMDSHRSPAFAHDMVALSLNAGYRSVLGDSGFGFRVTGGGQITIPGLGNEDLYGDLATSFWYRTDKFRLMTSFGGLVLVTQRGLGFSDRLLFNLGLAADLALGPVQPGVHFRLPIDKNVRDLVTADYGIHLAYFFAGPGK